MNYSEAKSNLATIQAAMAAAQQTVSDAQATIAALEPVAGSAQAALDQFHTFQCNSNIGAGDRTVSQVQFPDDASVNDTIATVVRTAMPDPVPCMVSNYDGVDGTWSDPEPGTIGWNDMGPVTQ